MNKICESADQAIADTSDKATIMLNTLVGPSGLAQDLILALRNRGVRELTVITVNFTRGTVSGRTIPSIITPDILVRNGQIKMAILSFAGTSRVLGVKPAIEEAYERGEIEIEAMPLGTLTERIRAGGAGIGGFYCPVGVGTPYEIGKETRVINGRKYILEYPLRANFGFVRAYKADKIGNLIYRGVSRGLNPLIALASDVTIAEVDEIVEPGELDPELIVTPGILVDRIVKSTRVTRRAGELLQKKQHDALPTKTANCVLVVKSKTQGASDDF